MNNLASQINEINVHGPGPETKWQHLHIALDSTGEMWGVGLEGSREGGLVEPVGHSGELVIELK